MLRELPVLRRQAEPKGLLPGSAWPSRSGEAPSPELASCLGKNAGQGFSDPRILSRGPAV